MHFKIIYPSAILKLVHKFFFQKIFNVFFFISGTSFIQEIVYLINNNVDLEAANKIPSFMRVPYMELIASPEEEETKTVRSLEVLNSVPKGETLVTFQRK